MNPIKASLATAVLLFSINVSSRAQQVKEFPPRLPPTFGNFPLTGGRVQSITVNPLDNNDIIVANQFGGLWRTTNAGATWVWVSSLPAVRPVDVAYAPDGNTVIATLERDNKVSNGGGIWVSRTRGASWSKPSTADPPSHPRIPARMSAHGISYAPDNANKVYAGTDYGIAVSDDNGNTWSHVMLENRSRVDGDRQQNAIKSVLALPGNKVMVLCRTGIYRSDDGGRVWSWIRTGNFSNGFKSIDVSPLDSDKVFVFQDYDSLLLYEVGANRWTRIPLYRHGDARGPFVRVSRSTRADTIDIWVGAGINLLKLAGTNHDAVKNATAGDWIALHRTAGLHDDSGYLALNNDRRPLLYGCDGGLFKPTNPEATMWTRAATGEGGMNSYQITSLAGTNVPSFHNTYQTSLYFATQDNGIWASPDGGLTWPYNDCAEGFHVQAVPEAEQHAGLTVAYGKMGCGPSSSMFSDAFLRNQRAVPNVDLAGNVLSGMEQAYLISKGNYIRYRWMPDGSIGIYVSRNNGLNWEEKANVTLELRGVFKVSGPAANPTIYIACKGTLTRPGNRERIGLIKLTGIYEPGVRRYGEQDMIYLPNDGSLGARATEWDWQSVYAVNPLDPDYIIAPDIQNQVVKVSRDGGATWATDEGLTAEVSKAGTLLLYDDDPYHMQVTHISFEHRYANRVLVGTREAGVISSDDGGRTWSTIPDTQGMLYVTGFFFKRDDTVVVSTYGRGLWTIDFGFFPRLPDDLVRSLCLSLRCLIRLPLDIDVRYVIDRIPKINPPIPRELLSRDMIIVRNGMISGLVMSGDKVISMTVTPGSQLRRSQSDAHAFSEVKVMESAQGAGFCNLKAAQGALQAGEVITGVILKKGKLLALISSDALLSERNNRGTVEVSLPDRQPRGRQNTDPNRPYLSVTTSVRMPGLPVLSKDATLRLFARGFDAQSNNYPVVLIDGQVVDQAVKTTPDGNFRAEIRVPENLAYGEHIIEVVQTIAARQLNARSSFVKAAIDDFSER